MNAKPQTDLTPHTPKFKLENTNPQTPNSPFTSMTIEAQEKDPPGGSCAAVANGRGTSMASSEKLGLRNLVSISY